MKTILQILSPLVFILSIISCQPKPPDQSKQKISLHDVEMTFSKMTAAGVNTNSTMLYGYFFTNDSPEELTAVAKELKSQNFDFVKIYQDTAKLYWLHLERKEIHTPNSLFRLNEELYAIADKHKLNSYDGFDVGNVDKTKPIDRNTYVVPEEFKTVNIAKDGKPLLLVLNTAFERFPHKDEFCYFVKITCNYKINDHSELPSIEDLDRLNEFDKFIENSLLKNSVKYYYVFRETSKGQRSFYLAVSETEKVTSILGNIQKEKNTIDFKFETNQDKNWEVFEKAKTEN